MRIVPGEPSAEAAVADVYRAHDIPAPRTVVWMDSPLGGVLASWVLRHGWENRLDGTLFTDVAAGPPLRVPQEFAQRSEERIREQLPAGGNSRPEADRVQEALYQVGGWWPLEDAVVLIERPVALQYEGDVLIRYTDGYQVEERPAQMPRRSSSRS